MGDFEDVERLQGGIREWLLRSARSGRHELRGIQGPAVLASLCAAAFGPALGEAADPADAVRRIGVLSSVRADALAGVLADAVASAVSAHAPAAPTRGELQREVGRGIGQALDADGNRAGDVRSDIAMVLREIDAAGTMLRAAIQGGDEDLEREVLAAVEAVSTEFGELEFMLADLARAAGEIQDGLRRQRIELRSSGGQARRQSADVRLIREELAVMERRARQYLAVGEPPAARWADGCPYRGLLPYDRAHEPVFFGRERLTAELAGALAEAGIVLVTGAVGAGKTSLLQAGLLPALSRGVQVPGSASWLQVSMVPGAQPVTELAAGLASLGGSDGAGIARRLADAPGEAHLLVRDLLLSAPGRTGPGDAPRLVLIIDQFERVFTAQEQERAAFIEAVCAAASRPAGAAGEPPALAVLAVRGDCWDRCAGYPQLVRAMQRDQLVVGPMTGAGLRRAITGPAEASGLRVDAALVEAILADLDAAGRERDTLLLPLLSLAMMLTWEKREGGRLTVGSYRAAGLRGQIGRAVEIAAGAAYAGRTQNQQAIARLRDWTEADRASLVLRRQLAEDSAGWRANGKDPARLYRGVRLAAAKEAVRVWQADPGTYPALGGGEADFLRAGDRAAARGRLRRRALAAGLAVLVLAALAGAGQAVSSARDTAERQRTLDLSERLAARSAALDGLDPVTASLLAGAAWRIAPTAQARYALLESFAQPVRGVLAARAGTVTALAHGPGGHVLAAGYSDGTIRLWDVASHRLLSTATWGTAALSLAFTGGGKALEVAAPGAVGSWNLADGTRVAMRPLPGSVPGAAVAFSPDGSMLATGGDDGNIRLWDPATQQEAGAPMSSDLRPVDAVAFSPDGATVAAASSDGTVQLWNAAARQEAGPAIVAGPAAVMALVFSQDGKLLATGGQDGNVKLWDIALQSQVGPAMATGGSVAALAFDAAGATLAVTGSGGTQLWDPATQRQTGASLAAPGSGAVDFGAGLLATGHGDGAIRLWDPAVLHQAAAPLATGVAAPSAAALGGGLLAVSDGHGTVRLWDTRTRRRTGRTIAARHAVTGLAISADGKTMAVAAGSVQLWATATGRRIGGPVPASASVVAVAVSPDGRLLAILGADGKARLWDVATRRQAGDLITGSGGTGALAFSPAGKTLALAGGTGEITLWSVATQRQIGQPVTAGAGSAAIAFSPDGTRLATAGTDGGVRLWDTATGQEIGSPMSAGPQPGYAVAFSPDGTRLATAGADGAARLWDVAFPARLLAAACSIAGQSLTPQQWSGYAGTRPFQQVCPAS